MDRQAGGTTDSLCDRRHHHYQLGVCDYSSGNVWPQLHLYCVEVECTPNLRDFLLGIAGAVGYEWAEVAQSSGGAQIPQKVDPRVFSSARLYCPHSMHHVFWCRGRLGADDRAVQQTDWVHDL